MADRTYPITTLATGFHFLEGPRWHNGTLYFSDFYGGKIYKLGDDGEVITLGALPQWVSGIGFAPNGDILAVGVEERKVYRLRTSGELVEHADLNGVASYRCNDMLVDERGRAYVGNFGFDVPPDLSDQNLKPGERIAPTNIFLISEEGEVSVAAGGLVFPNGMARTPDGKTLVVAETFAGRLSAFDIAPDGSLSGHRIWADFSDRNYETIAQSVHSGVPLPDGITVDSENAVWMADVNGSGVIRVADGGEILERIPTPGYTVFAVALGGPDLKTLFMCGAPPFLSHDATTDKSGVLLATQVDVPGIPG